MIGRENVGGYDVARLGAGDGAALQEWLDRNGYPLPEGAEPILSDYANEGWRFVAIRLAPKADGPTRSRWRSRLRPRITSTRCASSNSRPSRST